MITPAPILCQALSVHGEPCTRSAQGCYSVGRDDAHRVLCALCARALNAGGTPAHQDYTGNIRTWASWGSWRPQIKVSGGDSFPKTSTHGPSDVSAPGVEAQASQRAESRSSMMDRDAGTHPPTTDLPMDTLHCRWPGCTNAPTSPAALFCERDKRRALTLYGTSADVSAEQIATAQEQWEAHSTAQRAKRVKRLVEQTRARNAARTGCTPELRQCRWPGCSSSITGGSLSFCRTHKSRACDLYGTSSGLTNAQVEGADALWQVRVAETAAKRSARLSTRLPAEPAIEQAVAEFWRRRYEDTLSQVSVVRAEAEGLRRVNADLREDAYQAEMRAAKVGLVDRDRQVALLLVDSLATAAGDSAGIRQTIAALRLVVSGG